MEAKGHQHHGLQGRQADDSLKRKKAVAVFRRNELKTRLQWRVSALCSEYWIGRGPS